MKAVVDAGPLIALAKLGLVHLLGLLYDPVLVPDVVYQEVVTRGLELGQPDAYAVQMAVARQELVVVSVDLAETPTVQEAAWISDVLVRRVLDAWRLEVATNR